MIARDLNSNGSGRGQALIVVLILTLLGGLIGSAVSSMWSSGLQQRVVEQRANIAFYLAQAGLERAKADLKCNWNTAQSLPGNVPFGGGNYTYTIGAATGGRKEIIATGNFFSAQKVLRILMSPPGPPQGSCPGWQGCNKTRQVQRCWQENQCTQVQVCQRKYKWTGWCYLWCYGYGCCDHCHGNCDEWHCWSFYCHCWCYCWIDHCDVTKTYYYECWWEQSCQLVTKCQTVTETYWDPNCTWTLITQDIPHVVSGSWQDR